MNPLAEQARARSANCLSAVRQAVVQFETDRRKITLRAIAESARVSRNFIYTTPEALELVRQARDRTSDRVAPPRAPESKSVSEESLLMQLAAARLLIEELEAERQELLAKNRSLVDEVIRLQNPLPENVTKLRRRRG